MSRAAWLWRLLSRRLWFRAAGFSVAAVLLALFAAVIAPWVPYDLSAKIGADAVDNILQIIASSMLAVTTFSLTAMVSAYSAATSTVTPRAVKLLLEDTTSQNALSTFLGGFLFAIVGICALSTGLYGEQGRVILFAGTIVVILLIVLTLLRWIEHIARFGRVHETIARIEQVAIKAAHRLPRDPVPAALATGPAPVGARAVCCDGFGYVTHIDLDELEGCAAACGGEIRLAVLPGAFVDPERPVAWLASDDEAIAARVRKAITIAHDRSYDNDPRFGLIVLSEIASRALSPAVNDPGTALAALGAQLRVIAALFDREARDPSNVPLNVTIPALTFEDIVTDAFRPIARDGAAMVEVAVKLQKTLASAAHIAPAMRDILGAAAREARERADAALDHPADREAVAQAHRAIGG
ncbi:DUF2254 domain-containing protein [Sphingomonas baiyangensis]|uniref:DUF2254 domain-containing protein n=1 Tax=Sphingomonas baiyangensis TaxID=2572576 RepID=A0A4U1L537_9SPHN|nr:DUF2254 domain-containing protein [Sphingomonas baiyangensis]TKD51306.1 DUF2254 domain-containing protein [Sphingomonas baiyangensis]